MHACHALAFSGLRHMVVAVQDAYMPKDASKQSHRGIGFVTFSSSDSVEAVMSTPHSLNGQELAIDRATPKDKASASIALLLCMTRPAPFASASADAPLTLLA